MKINHSALTALAAASLIALTACTPEDDKPAADAPISTAPASTAPASSAPAEAAGSSAVRPDQASGIKSLLDSAPAVSRRVQEADTSDTGAELADGRWPGNITRLDGARSLRFNLVEFLTGDAAEKQWAKEHPGAAYGAPNGYVIVDNNPRLRTLSLATPVHVEVLQGGVPETIALKELPGHFAAITGRADEFTSALFWLTVKDGQVTAIEQQYLP